MQGLPEAVMYRPPHGNGTTDAGAVKSVALVAATATAEQDSGAVNGAWVTFRTDADCYVRFGVTGIASGSSSDYQLLATDGAVSWWLRPEDRYFKAFGGAGAGTLKWYLS